ncbi:uncharacterized protein HMPREF1541_09402 [Cyphellophora europaea CBS 101466]|uniref:FAD-binding domain-containing protein n=1 Tax=Cyphellophora europaea (strain CBS 101466) TaxID=1220924 RepID=W2SAA9_CYPE1|nr:uncharacterized protein HMPREF1541_09402 [Cyphellophora europaea CBS 101466]ETN45570.1 hypothetical protein HMPREF1541_09402 [Cyphellophora europaea CBS 101466]
MKIIIVGAGLAGTASALALTKWMPSKPEITVVELRTKPLTMGGAIGLTPNALRALHALGVMEGIKERRLGADIDRIELFDVYSAARLGNINFCDAYGNGVGKPSFKGLRILRSDLLVALLATTKQHSNIKIRYGRTVNSITEDDDAVVIGFAEDQVQLTADLLIGADGIHSMVRKLHVEPDRAPKYTGIAAIGGFAVVSPDHPLQWEDTALSQSLRGSLLCSHYERTRTRQFIAAVMETEDVRSKEGWIAMGKEQEEIKRRVKERYLGANIKMHGIPPLIESSRDWNLYPVYALPPQGKWSTGRVILVGDAAHAMPPQGESAGIAFEDAVILGRTMCTTDDKGLTGRLAVYERLRRPRTDEAYRQASFGWNTLKDSGWLAFQIRSWVTWAFLWWTAKSRALHYGEDLATKELDFS